MGSKRFQGKQIGSLTPALDARNVEELYVLGGRNYSFDSKGPKTDFGNRFMTPVPMWNPGEIHGNRIAGRTFVHTQDALLEWDPGLHTWIPAYYFPETTLFEGYRWNAAFLNQRIYLAHKNYGYITCVLTPALRFEFAKLNSTIVPGLPDSPLGMIETNARLVILTATSVYWSGPSNGMDFTPGPGGAGFMLVAERVGGTPLAITSFAGGFIVWTDSGALLAEFIGGTAVWRYSTLTGTLRPQNAMSLIRQSLDETLVLTNQGLFISENGQPLKAVHEVFNEFLRDYLSLNPKAEGRLEFDTFRGRIYVLLRTHEELYDRTFVLVPTLDAWGEFSEFTYGILPLTETDFGFLDREKYLRFWLEAPSREILPAPEVDLLYPRFIKRMITGDNQWSSSVRVLGVSSPVPKNEDLYDIGQDSPTQHAVTGLDAEIQIGYFRPTLLDEAVDGLLEIQQLLVGSYPMALPADLTQDSLEYKYLQAHYDSIYRNIEDWDILTGNQDWNDDAPSEDWQNQVALLSKNSYKIHIESSLDGETFLRVDPSRARFDTSGTIFSCETSGLFHKVVFKAEEPGDTLQIRLIEVTFGYGGRL